MIMDDGAGDDADGDDGDDDDDDEEEDDDDDGDDDGWRMIMDDHAYGLKTEPAFCMFLCLSWG